jgi:poly(3-hydroxybutyrate) depolymerase
VRWALVRLVLVALLVAACGASHAAPSVPSARASAASAHDDLFSVGDGQVSVHVPAHPTGIGVVVLHGFLETVAIPVTQGWSASSDRHGFVAIYPGRGDSWNAGLCCDSASAAKRDDVSWLVTAINIARSRYGLKTIYLAGNSNGGMMVERLLAERPSVSNRFAVWAAAPEMPVAGYWTGEGSLFSGTDDLIIPRHGGRVVIGGILAVIRPAASTGRWLKGAHLHQTVIPGQAHAPPPDWPEIAWSALSH